MKLKQFVPLLGLITIFSCKVDTQKAKEGIKTFKKLEEVGREVKKEEEIKKKLASDFYLKGKLNGTPFKSGDGTLSHGMNNSIFGLQVNDIELSFLVEGAKEELEVGKKYKIFAPSILDDKLGTLHVNEDIYVTLTEKTDTYVKGSFTDARFGKTMDEVGRKLPNFTADYTFTDFEFYISYSNPMKKLQNVMKDLK